MLTRLEVDGFKNLLGFAIDFGPLTCLAGPNAVGKSNVFDAIQLLSLLADERLVDAAMRVRAEDAGHGKVRDLFWTDGEARSHKIKLAAEMLVARDVVDDYGRKAQTSSTYLRYELELTEEPVTETRPRGGLRLLAERLTYFTKSEAAKRLRFPHSAGGFRGKLVFNARRTKAGYISTEPDETLPHGGGTVLVLHQDGGAGRPQRFPADAAERTLVSLTNSAASPTVLAARREMQRWRTLAFEPAALRRPDAFHAEPSVSTAGGHLAVTLWRLAHADGAEPEDLYARVAGRVSELVRVRRLTVDKDDARELFTLLVEEEPGRPLPARSLSDGTLRFLALSILAEDPDVRGLLAVEEPENGIHPEKMSAMLDLLRDIAVKPKEEVGPDNPPRQVLIASHSPALVQLMARDDLLFATTVAVPGPGGHATRALRCLPLRGTWRVSGDQRGVAVEVLLDYLVAQEDAQL